MVFIGERESDQRKTEPQAVQKEVFLWTPFKNFKKYYLSMFFKVFEIPKNFFQKVLWWGAGVKPLPYKTQFENISAMNFFPSPRRGDFAFRSNHFSETPLQKNKDVL